MNSRCRNSAGRNIYYQSLTKRALHFILKNMDRSKRIKKNVLEKSVEGPPIKEKAKQIWSWLISKRMQNGLYFEAKQRRTEVCCMLPIDVL